MGELESPHGQACLGRLAVLRIMPREVGNSCREIRAVRESGVAEPSAWGARVLELGVHSSPLSQASVGEASIGIPVPGNSVMAFRPLMFSLSLCV